MYILYHICREGDISNYEEGYVGITKRDTESRWKEHRAEKDWYNDYDDIVEYVILECSKKEIIELEEELRPRMNMGWNTTQGGGLPFGHPAAKYARYGKCKRKFKKK